MKISTLRYFIILLSCIALLLSVSAHSGGTDSKGGHRNSVTGEYHYHHGHSAHQHTDLDGDGVKDCPFDFDDKTGHSSGSKSSSQSSSQTPDTYDNHFSATPSATKDSNEDGEEENIFETKQSAYAVVGTVAVAVFLIFPNLWNTGKKKHTECIEKGNVYYGILYYRIALIYFVCVLNLALITSYFTNNSFEDTHLLILSLLSGIPLSVFYIYLYKKMYIMIYLSHLKEEDGH